MKREVTLLSGQSPGICVWKIKTVWSEYSDACYRRICDIVAQFKTTGVDLSALMQKNIKRANRFNKHHEYTEPHQYVKQVASKPPSEKETSNSARLILGERLKVETQTRPVWAEWKLFGSS